MSSAVWDVVLDISKEWEKTPLNQEKQKYSCSRANLQLVPASISGEAYEQRESKHKLREVCQY